jgi:8-oxo-dGTP diphosphatase
MTYAAHSESLARPVTAAGILFFDGDGRVLIVKPSYKEGWDIPGGYVEPSESPFNAARREVREELQLDVTPGVLLAVDWAPDDQEGDKLLFVFDGGTLDRTQREAIVLASDELLEYEYCWVKDLPARMPERLARRVVAAVDNRTGPTRVYLEHGEPCLRTFIAPHSWPSLSNPRGALA